MAQQTDKSDQKYRSLRDDFDNLQLEEKAVFLIESGLSMFIHGIESLTTLVRDEINKMADEGKGNPEGENEEASEKKAAPKKKTRSTTTKRKSTRSRSTSTNKSAPKKGGDSEDGAEKAD